MDFKFSKNSEDSHTEDAHDNKKKQSALLILLVILVGGFTYLYFFTGLIKPQQAKKPAAVADTAAQTAKIPLPVRDGEQVKSSEKPVDKSVPAKTAATVAAASPTVAANTVKPSPPAPAPVAKPVQTPPKPKEEPKKTEAAKPVDKKQLPAQTTEKKGTKTAAAKTEEKKPAVADKKTASAKEASKAPAASKRSIPAPGADNKKTTSGSWSLVVGNYVLEETLAVDMGHVRKAGFEPIVKPSTRKKTTMNRLFVSDFSDRASAQPALEKLKRQTSDAFVIEQDGKFVLYAGSYLQSDAANTEKDRLKSNGFPTTIKHAEIAIPSQSLTVGPFNSRKAADAALLKLKNSGIKAVLQHN